MAGVWSAVKAKAKGLMGALAVGDPIYSDSITAVVGGIPSGFIFACGKADRPAGFLLCDGAAYSRTVYDSLFVAIGTSFGAGDGSTTFNVPDLRGRSIVSQGQGLTAEGAATGTARSVGQAGGAEGHTLGATQIPAHTHGVSYDKTTYVSDASLSLLGSGNRVTGFTPTAATSSSVGGGLSHNNMHPFVVCSHIIRY